MSDRRQVILASASMTRQAMLANAGIPFVAKPAYIDEAAIKNSCLSQGDSPEKIALQLAREKARVVSADHPSSLVIGSDQILAIDGELLSKTADRPDALSKLRKLQGRTHQLHSAVACFLDGELTFELVDTAELTMKPMSDQELLDYLDDAGPEIHKAVGCYQIESKGIRLFKSIRGSHFTIMGMPLLPLLGYLDASLSDTTDP
ncbi:MAG: nucleoside triphosphate pyrophosphatase [Anderseniella sp.]|nr:nucleoside triphosphate pyrophosphatase [Anderseniella sp.]